MDSLKPSLEVNEFLRNITPAATRSRLAPYWEDITKLRESNCTLGQVCAFLKGNGVHISVVGLSTYIKRRKEKEEKGGVPVTASRAETSAINRPQAERSTRTTGPVRTGHRLEPTSSNPLNALSGSRRLGEFNPIPTAKIEFDE
jgi:hypothetical protein